MSSFLEKVIKNNLDDPVIFDGVAKSEFAGVSGELNSFIKKFITKCTTNDKTKMKMLLTSGGLSTSSLSNEEKHYSFCSDFPQLVCNLKTLLGYEFYRNCLVIKNAKQQIKQLINSIPKSTSYEDLETILEEVQALFSLPGMFSYPKNFEFPSFLKFSPLQNQIITLDTIISDEEEYENDFSFFDVLIAKSTRLKNLNTATIFETDKYNWFSFLTKFYDSTKVSTYKIDSIDDFSIFTNEKSIGYENNIFPLLKLLYEENSPMDLTGNSKPLIQYFNKMNLCNYSELLDSLIYYFNLVSVWLKKDLVNETNLCEIEVSTECYTEMGIITLNFFVQILKKIEDMLYIHSNWGKNVKIQFIDLLQAVLACAPRLEKFNDSQIDAISFFLQSSKSLKESRKTFIAHISKQK